MSTYEHPDSPHDDRQPSIYPNGQPTYTSSTAVPGERPLSGRPEPSTAAYLGERGVERVSRLIDANVENARELDSAAEDVADQPLRARFRAIADQRRGFADELRGLVNRVDDDERLGARPGRTLRRWWHQVTTRGVEGNTRAVLEGAERGEDRLLAEYRCARSDLSHGPLGRVIEDQAMHVQRVHDEVKGLRDHWHHRG